MLHLVLGLTFLFYVYGGTKCPPRGDIYPCICMDRHIGKSKSDATVICHGLDDENSFLKLEPSLKEMEISKFLLYDSFWNKDTRRLQMNSQVPVNMFSSFKIEEVHVVDTVLATFGCPENYNCRTSYVKRFTVINSTLPETSCENNFLKITSWLSCPDTVEKLIIDRGFSKDFYMKPDFFPVEMLKLKALHLQRNRITRIDRKTFTSSRFPEMEILDLSYNYLREGKQIFSSMLKLKELDLSYNALRTGVDFQYLPHLQTIKLRNNMIKDLTPDDWQKLPENLRHVDLTDNKIACSCEIRFINPSFHINAMLLGSCDEPANMKGKNLRKSCRYFTERCNEEGAVGKKKRKVKSSTPPPP